MTEAKFCIGPIQYPTGATNQDGSPVMETGYIEFPCGARTDPGGLFQPQDLPYRYQILRERARLARCCYWREEERTVETEIPSISNTDETPYIYEYKVITLTGSQQTLLPSWDIYPERDSTTKITIPNPESQLVGGWLHEADNPSFLLRPFDITTLALKSPIPTKCKHPSATSFHQGSDQRPPCNGAKTKCPYYTGPKFQHIKDEDLEPGKPILGQMVQELRSFMLEWEELDKPQQTWEDVFNLPYLWGKDFDTRQAETVNDVNNEFAEVVVYTILTQVYWDIEQGVAKLTNIPGATVGTEVSKLDPPDFPTIVNELGETLEPLVKFTFPMIKTFNYVKLEGKTAIYICGKCRPNYSLYVVNLNKVKDFPKFEKGKFNSFIESEDVTKAIERFIYKNSSGVTDLGFLSIQSDEAGFWEVRSGMDLIPNSDNNLLVLSNKDNRWYYDSVNVKFDYHLVDLWQDKFISNLSSPSSDNLILKLSSIHESPESQSPTFLLRSDEAISIKNVYHYYIKDREYSRFVHGDSEEKVDLDTGLPYISAKNQNERSFSIHSSTLSFLGTGKAVKEGVSRELVWRKINNCNRFLVYIYGTNNKSIPLMKCPGLDRSWEPSSIYFLVSDIKYEMKVSEDFGRDLSGEILPTNAFFIEPKNNNSFPFIENSSLLRVDLSIFNIKNLPDQINPDTGINVTKQLIEDFSDSENKFVGGVLIPNITSNDVYKNFSHKIKVDERSGTYFSIINNYAKHDLSYIVELFSKTHQRVIGSKWVYGLAELDNRWSRDIDIYYSWSSNQEFKRLKPDYWRAIRNKITGYVYPVTTFIDTGRRGEFEDNNYVVYRPSCFDHDSILGTSGPLFYPYDKCSDSYVEVKTLGFSFRYRIPYSQSIDEKYRGPDIAAPKIYKHNVGSLIIPCVFDFSWGTFFRQSSSWAGVSRLRGPISENFNILKFLLYKSLGYRFPQFGNTGRDQVRSITTMHYREFLYLSNGRPKVGEGWLPAIPYCSGATLFSRDNSNPITPLDKIIENQSSVLDFTDLDTFSIGTLLLSISTEGEEVLLENSLISKEVYLNNRKKFDDVFKIRKVRSSDGVGSMWPPQGYYYNFRSIKVDWAFSEPESDQIFRNTKTIIGDVFKEQSYITGITISKPIVKNNSFLTANKDKFNRPLSLCPKEDNYFLVLIDQVYDEDNKVVNYASISLQKSNKSYGRVYFDRYNGDIKEYSSERNEELNIKEVYAATNKLELLTILTNKGIELQTTPLFKDDLESPNYPNDIVNLEEYSRIGNLLGIDSGILVYSIGNIDKNPLDDSLPEEWIGLFLGLNIDSINIHFLPQKELSVNTSNLLKYTVRFSAYPGETPKERAALSNLNLSGLTFFTKEISYKPLSTAEEELVVGPYDYDPRYGYINPVTIKITFLRPIALSTLNLSYELVGLEINSYDPMEFTYQRPVYIKADPSFTIKYKEYKTGLYKTILDKPEYKYNNRSYPHSSLSRSFIFSYNNETLEAGSSSTATKTKLYSSISLTELQIQIGPRDPRVGFKLVDKILKYANLNEITEEVLVLESRYHLTGGMSVPGDIKFLPAQDPQYLSSIIPSIDLSDIYEYAGIAEFWRPGNLSEESVGSIGKLHRHWASKFNTWDTASLFYNEEPKVGETIFYDDKVEISEGRQVKVITEAAQKANSDMNSRVYYLEYNSYISPFDKALLKNTYNTTNLISTFKIGIPLNTLQELNLPISIGTLAPGWQDFGYEACIKPGESAQIERCSTGSSFAWNRDSQGLCRGESYLEALYLIEMAGKYTLLGVQANLQDKLSEKMNEISETSSDYYRNLQKQIEKRNKGRFQL